MLDVAVLTIFPKIFDSFLSYGNPARAIEGNFLRVNTIDIRDFTSDRHRSTDDYPYGGGTGMVMKPEPVVSAIRHVRASNTETKVILMTPQGKPFNQGLAEELVDCKSISLVCGRYEGIDERIRYFVDVELSIGDYVLSGGEIAAMVVIDSIVRLIPGVLGADSHIEGESFYDGILEYPQYTRPRVFENMEVPSILLEGHHAKIKIWRKKKALARTLRRRPDLVSKKTLDDEEQRLLWEIQSEIDKHVEISNEHFE
jgi:tRNA (guanine37-N1)-methyltransferase